MQKMAAEDVTVEQAADSIVSRGSKGVWILSQSARVEDREVNLTSFGYKDDALILRNTACIVMHP